MTLQEALFPEESCQRLRDGDGICGSTAGPQLSTLKSIFENPVIVIYLGDFSTHHSCSDFKDRATLHAATARNDGGTGRVRWICIGKRRRLLSFPDSQQLEAPARLYDAQPPDTRPEGPNHLATRSRHWLLIRRRRISSRSHPFVRAHSQKRHSLSKDNAEKPPDGY